MDQKAAAPCIQQRLRFVCLPGSWTDRGCRPLRSTQNFSVFNRESIKSHGNTDAKPIIK